MVINKPDITFPSLHYDPGTKCNCPNKEPTEDRLKCKRCLGEIYVGEVKVKKVKK